jgi:hypothetical protein
MKVLLCLLFCLIPLQVISAETDFRKTTEATVIFDKASERVAQEVIRVYPAIKAKLAGTLRWEVDFRPEIFLTSDKTSFRKMAGGEIISAFAVPDKRLIVIDSTRVFTKPFTLETTLEHELCHLLLHRYIQRDTLPRWMDEGVCQWTTGGVAELIYESGNSLEKAVLADKMIALSELERFPSEEKSLILAYEESKSFIEYIANEYSKQKMLNVLALLKEGNSPEESIEKSLSISLTELEKNWHVYLRRKHTWFSYLSNNLYTILFVIAALITVYGFIRLLKKKREYKDAEEEEDINGE